MRQYKVQTSKQNKFYVERKGLFGWRKIGNEFDSEHEATLRCYAYSILDERKKYVSNTKLTVEDIVAFNESIT